VSLAQVSAGLPAPAQESYLRALACHDGGFDWIGAGHAVPEITQMIVRGTDGDNGAIELVEFVKAIRPD
jgi:hypothetical protein